MKFLTLFLTTMTLAFAAAASGEILESPGSYQWENGTARQGAGPAEGHKEGMPGMETSRPTVKRPDSGSMKAEKKKYGDGFRGYTWGSDITTMRSADPKLVEGHRGAMPGVVSFQRTDDDLNFGGVKAEGITYVFFKGKFTSVAIDFRGFDGYEKLLAHCKELFGPVTASAVLRLEQYDYFDTPRTGAMLLYQYSQQTQNYGRLYLYSKEQLK
jgi:hypothetical protein